MGSRKPSVLTNAYRNECDQTFEQIREQMRDERSDKMNDQTVIKW